LLSGFKSDSCHVAAGFGQALNEADINGSANGNKYYRDLRGRGFRGGAADCSPNNKNVDIGEDSQNGFLHLRYSRSGKLLPDQPDVLAIDISEFAKTGEHSFDSRTARFTVDVSDPRNTLALLGMRDSPPKGGTAQCGDKVAAFH
jgi:hypothetical protein